MATRTLSQAGDKPAHRRKARPRRLRARPLELSVSRILKWADLFHRATGRWPNRLSWPTGLPAGETWPNVNKCLTEGRRGLPGGDTLLHLLVQQRGLRHERYLPALSVRQILAWADAHHRRTGHWPNQKSGPLAGAEGETWNGIAEALRKGKRGLSPPQSLADFLAKHRGVRNVQHLPDLSESQILAWADRHRARHGRWPTSLSGSVVEAPGETWSAINASLIAGRRGLPGKSSLPRLLAAKRGRPNHLAAPRLSIEQILAWADAHHARTGRWPKRDSGPIQEAAGESWHKVASALRAGLRGLRQGQSLASLLEQERGVRNHLRPPQLSVTQILRWADLHRRRTGRWPWAHAGPIADAQGETWDAIDTSLTQGRRGLPSGLSVAKLLAKHRGTRNVQDLPRLSVARILHWADAHHKRHGSWPRSDSGSVADVKGESWRAIDAALRQGARGLPGGSSLIRLLAARRGVRNRSGLPKLSAAQILRWAAAHRRRTGDWPTRNSGLISEAPTPKESWRKIDSALGKGFRGLSSGGSLALLLAQQRGVRGRYTAPPLTIEQIVRWADAYHEKRDRWPGQGSEDIGLPPGERWKLIEQALRKGFRGLPGGTSLAQILVEHRGARNVRRLGRLSPPLVITWARTYRQRMGKWPNKNSGPIPESPTNGDTWHKIAVAFSHGLRGLSRGGSLARVLKAHS